MSNGYWQYCSFDEPHWKSCTKKEYEMYEALPMFETRINPEQWDKFKERANELSN